MNDYTSIAKRFSIITLVFVSVSLIVAVLGFYPLFFQGLSLGALFSLFSLLSTYFQVKRVGNSVQSGRVKWFFGTTSRILLFVVAISIAVKFSAYFHLIGVVIGLMFTYLLLLIGPAIFRKSFSN
ncbi:ATP synthase subunit I [Salipaludibacillus sp. CF4.18]|uniref:ATP synthase subunit I n=1 Tax=Salipaludibacillus sp. CF4.18 TaxID=3373081 RepID=UPI003EE61E63